METEALRRLYVSVEQSRIFGTTAELGSVVVCVTAGGGARIESGVKRAETTLQWGWESSLQPAADCHDVVLALEKKRLFGGAEILGDVAIPLSSLNDQQLHSFQVAIQSTHAPRKQMGEVRFSLRLADYEALRQHIRALEAAAPSVTTPAYERALGGCEVNVSSAPRPPPPLPVPTSPPTRAANAARMAQAAAGGASPSSRWDGVTPLGGANEVGFVYQDAGDAGLHAEIEHEHAELTAARTEAAIEIALPILTTHEIEQIGTALGIIAQPHNIWLGSQPQIFVSPIGGMLTN